MKTLINSSRKILIRAINSKGTSMRNYTTTEGTLGSFQTQFKVYNKDGKILKFRIRRIKQCGRSTFFCPELQKSKYNPIFDWYFIYRMI